MRMQASSPRTPNVAMKKQPMLQPPQHQPQQQHRLSPPRRKLEPPAAEAEPQFENMDLSSEMIDQEVNMALSELKISHPDIGIDFGFGRIDSNADMSGSFGGSGTRP